MVTAWLRRIRVPWIAGVAVATAHYLLFWSTFLLGFGLGMADFDEGPTAKRAIGRVLFELSQLLAVPIASAIFRSPSHNLPSWQQHAILVANSLLWGAGALVVVWAIGRLHYRTTNRASPPGTTPLA